MEFGERLRSLREEYKLSRNELAEKLIISYSAISKYETNIRFPDKDTLIKMADFFNVSIDYLLGRSDIKETAEQIINRSGENLHISSPQIKYGTDEKLPSEAVEEIEKFKQYIHYKYKRMD